MSKVTLSLFDPVDARTFEIVTPSGKVHTDIEQTPSTRGFHPRHTDLMCLGCHRSYNPRLQSKKRCINKECPDRKTPKPRYGPFVPAPEIYPGQIPKELVPIYLVGLGHLVDFSAPVAHLGMGGSARVYEVTLLATSTLVAIKIPYYSTESEFLEEWDQECEATRKAGDICVGPKVHDWGRTPRPYLIMDVVGGTPLGGAELTKELAWDILNKIEALGNIGIVHRDLSRYNILLTREGAIKIVDYGGSEIDFGFVGDRFKLFRRVFIGFLPRPTKVVRDGARGCLYQGWVDEWFDQA